MDRSAALAKLESLASQNQTSSDARNNDVDAAMSIIGPYIPEFLTLPIFGLLDLPTIMQILGHPKCACPSDATLVAFASNLIKCIGLPAAALLRFADLERDSTVVRLCECLSDAPALLKSVSKVLNIQDVNKAELKMIEKDMDSFYNQELERIKEQTEQLRKQTE